MQPKLHVLPGHWRDAWVQWHGLVRPVYLQKFPLRLVQRGGAHGAAGSRGFFIFLPSGNRFNRIPSIHHHNGSCKGRCYFDELPADGNERSVLCGSIAIRRGYCGAGELDKSVQHRHVKSLNNRLEADRGALKRLINPTRGFKTLPTASATIKRFEVMRVIRKRQRLMLEPGTTEEVRLCEPVVPARRLIPQFRKDKLREGFANAAELGSCTCPFMRARRDLSSYRTFRGLAFKVAAANLRCVKFWWGRLVSNCSQLPQWVSYLDCFKPPFFIHHGPGPWGLDATTVGAAARCGAPPGTRRTRSVSAKAAAAITSSPYRHHGEDTESQGMGSPLRKRGPAVWI